MDTGSRFFCSVDILPDYYSFYHCSFERFEQIERAFYSEHYDDYCEAQQETTFGISSLRDKDVDLQACAEAYLRDIGMSEEEILALKKNLSTSYPTE